MKAYFEFEGLCTSHYTVFEACNESRAGIGKRFRVKKKNCVNLMSPLEVYNAKAPNFLKEILYI